MKKLIGILSLLSLIGLTTQAQKKSSDDFILISNDFNLNRTTNGSLFTTSYNHSGLIGLQYIRSMSDNKANRFGMGVLHSSSGTRIDLFQRNDTIAYSEYNKDNSAFYVSIGKEYRKMLHTDVMIIGGADIGAGIGGSSNYTSEVGLTDSLRYIRTIDPGATGFITVARCTPFLGMRISWKRLAIGYSIKAPIQMDYTSLGNWKTFSIETNLQQSISLGYRIYNRKKSS